MYKRLLVAALLLTSPIASNAGVISVSHLGAEFSLDELAFGGNTATFRYTADFSAGMWTGRDFITAIGFGLDGYAVVSSTLDSTTAAGTWSNTIGPVSSGGCGESESVLFCSSDPFAAPNQPTTGIVEWVFTIVFDHTIDPADFANPANTISADFCNIDGGIASCGDGFPTDGNSVPEPGTLALLGVGLAALGLKRGKKTV